MYRRLAPPGGRSCSVTFLLSLPIGGHVLFPWQDCASSHPSLPWTSPGLLAYGFCQGALAQEHGIVHLRSTGKLTLWCQTPPSSSVQWRLQGWGALIAVPTGPLYEQQWLSMLGWCDRRWYVQVSDVYCVGDIFSLSVLPLPLHPFPPLLCLSCRPALPLAGYFAL